MTEQCYCQSKAEEEERSPVKSGNEDKEVGMNKEHVSVDDLNQGRLSDDEDSQDFGVSEEVNDEFIGNKVSDIGSAKNNGTLNREDKESGERKKNQIKKYKGSQIIYGGQKCNCAECKVFSQKIVQEKELLDHAETKLTGDISNFERKTKNQIQNKRESKRKERKKKKEKKKSRNQEGKVKVNNDSDWGTRKGG